MGDGSAALKAQIARLRTLGTMVQRAAPGVAQALEREIVAQVAAGLGPDGKPLVRTQDGRQPLQGAARALRVRAVGTVIVARLEGHHALHHRGTVRGGVRRPVLPTDAASESVARAIQKTLAREFGLLMGGE